MAVTYTLNGRPLTSEKPLTVAKAMQAGGIDPAQTSSTIVDGKWYTPAEYERELRPEAEVHPNMQAIVAG